MIDIIVLALLSFLIVKKLNKILGEEYDVNTFGKDGNQAKKIKNVTGTVVADQNDSKSSEQVDTTFCGFEYLTDESKRCFRDLQENNKNFSLKKFQEISSRVIDMCITAYSGKNQEVLEGLMSKELSSSFMSALTESRVKNQNDQIVLVKIDDYKIENITDDKDSFKIVTSLVMSQIHYTENNDLEVVAGSRSTILKVQEKWTFIKSKANVDSNWLVSGIEIIEH